MVRPPNLKAEWIRYHIGTECNRLRLTLEQFLLTLKTGEKIADRVPGLEDYKRNPTPIREALKGKFYYI